MSRTVGRMVSLARGFIFLVAFYFTTTCYLIAYLPALPFLSRRALWTGGVMPWVATTGFLLRVICGIRVRIDGLENIPDGPLLIAAKHQSAWETLALLPLFRDPAFILKRELMRIPVFGWYAAKARMIPVDRSAGRSALLAMSQVARAELAHDRQILIFPEGTRRPPGAAPAYKAGVAALYSKLDVPCLPVALNSGLYWPRRSLIKRPGTIRVEILPPIPPGLPRDAFMTRIEAEIEAASNRLLTDGLTELGAQAPEIMREAGTPPPLSTPVENS